MFKVLKEEQRPRRKGKLFEMHSYLPFHGGYVKPFGDLMGAEEVLVSPGGRLSPDNHEMDFLFLGREGRITYQCERQEAGYLQKNSCLVSHPFDPDLEFSNESTHAVSRFISLGFRPGKGLIPPESPSFKIFSIKGTRTIHISLASGSEPEEALHLTLDAEVSLARIGKGERLIFETRPARRMVMIVLEGSLDAEKHRLNRNDSFLVMGEPQVILHAAWASKVLIIDLPEYSVPVEKRNEDWDRD